MKTLQIRFIFAFFFAFFAAVANGFHFYGPYDIFKARAARWPATETDITQPSDNGFLNRAEGEQDYYKIISYLNDVGRRRR